MPYDPLLHGPRRVVGPGFQENVYAMVRRVPPGTVTTYGDIGRALGLTTIARQVGYALAALPSQRTDVPWHRVVNARGAISVTERAAYIGRIRNLARSVAQSYYDSRERLGFPMAPREWVAQMAKKAA